VYSSEDYSRMAKKDLHYVVFDIETQKSFKEISDRKKLYQLKISVVGVYDSKRDEYEAYEEKDLMKVDEIFREADVAIGFNSDGFDFPVIAPYLFTPVENIMSLDLMLEIQKSIGHRVSLQSVAEGTLGSSKSGDGLGAIDMFRDGRMEELKKYCLDDVRITKEIYEYGCKHGKISFTSNRDWKTHEVKIDWGNLKVEETQETVFPSSLF
jgi:DEAD/DEAH box helicase domain-containing protein